LMAQRLADHLAVGALSNHVNLSPARLQQLFKLETGCTPVQYLRILRMQRAECLLQSSFLSVKEISFRIGRRDVSHFVRDFKKQYGLTPKKFRARHGTVATTYPAW
jgi:AraC-like DNA-binding protein